MFKDENYYDKHENNRRCGKDCDNPPTTETHHCPFALEIYGEHCVCNCCDECEGDCAMDI
jgi:hypothetical protein